MCNHSPNRAAWRMYAHSDSGLLTNVGPRRYVELHGLELPIVAVDVTEAGPGDPAGWLGWLATGDDAPRMIQPKYAFEMQFPYGSQAEEKAGRGRVVRLAVGRALEREEAGR